MRKPSILLLIFFAAALLVASAGYWYYDVQRGRVRQEVESTLRAVAELKAAEIGRWRQNLVDVASVLTDDLSRDPLFASMMDRPSPSSTASVLASLKSIAERMRYDDVRLAAPSGDILVSVAPFHGEHAPEERAAALRALTSGSVAISDLHRHEDDGVKHLDVVAPVPPPSRLGPPMAMVVIQVSPDRFLYPMIKGWPVPSRTGETLLVRREGDRVLFLNDLRHRSGVGLNLSFPLTEENLPAAQAVQGREGYFEGHDYRGVMVASYLLAVPSTPWFIVSKVDSSEAFAEMQRTSAVLAALVLSFIGAAFLATRSVFVAAQRSAFARELALERTRREGEERYRVTILSMGDGVIVTDEFGLVKLLNPLAEALTGWSDAEARGRELTEIFRIVNMDTRRTVKNPVTEAIERNVAVGLANHTLLIARDGSERPIADSAAPIRDETGRITGVVLLFRDQTEEYRARLEVERSERRFRELFTGMLEGFALHEIILDERGVPCDYRFIEVNPAFERITGLKAKEIVGRRATVVIPGLEKDWIETYCRVATTGEQLSFREYNSGLDKHFDVFAYRPAPGQFACLFRDVSAEVSARRALESRILALTRPQGGVESLELGELFDLEQLQEIQEAFANATGVASIIYDMEGRALTRPSNFTRFCGEVVRTTEVGQANCCRSAAELGRSAGDGPTIRPCLSAGLMDAGAPIMVGTRQIANWIIGQVRGTAIDEEAALNHAGKLGADPERYLEALREVPVMEAQRFEAAARALYQLAHQLSTMAYQNLQQARLLSEQRHAEQEKEHLTQKLIQAQKLESVGRLAGGVAHDFNNMLSVILGNSELAAERLAEDDPSREYLSEIRAAAERSAQITRQLLAFARKQAVSPRVIDLNSTVERALKMLSRLIGEEVRVVWRAGRELWPVRIDPVQLEQVLANLTTNARDAISGVGVLTIESANVEIGGADTLLHPDAAPGEYVMLTVSDTGKGMSPEVLAHVFEPFYTTKGVGEGTGLGLATVYGIARQNGGFVTAESLEGRGSSFHVYLPRHSGVAEGPEKQASQAGARGSEMVLIVEDEPGILNLARRILASHGYQVLSANSPEDALVHSAQNPGAIDLLLTDVVMPVMNGRDLAKNVSLLQPGMKVLYMSGYAAEMIGSRGVLEEGVNFMTKPFSVTDLTRKVRDVLDGAPGGEG